MPSESDDNYLPIGDEWFDNFSEMAERALGDGSACDQIHPIVETWFAEYREQDEEPERGSVEQALSCLTTEVLTITPPHILDALFEAFDEDELYDWVQAVLATGRAFQRALDTGRLDDL